MFTNFDDVTPVSCNSVHDLNPGIYRERQATFASEDGLREMVLRMYTQDGSDVISVVDCVIADQESGNFLFQDFLRLPTGLWRSGDGQEAETFLSMLPEGAADFVQVSPEVDGDTIEITKK